MFVGSAWTRNIRCSILRNGFARRAQLPKISGYVMHACITVLWNQLPRVTLKDGGTIDQMTG